MAFPEDPLGLLAEILVDGQWEKLPLYTRDPITHQRGIRNQGRTADPAAVPMTINNKNGKYSPRNPMSPYYGKIGRNTPVRLSLPGGTPRMLLPHGGAGRAWTPDTAALDITTSIDVRIEVNIANWTAGTIVELCGKYDLLNAGRSWLMMIAATGGITFRRSLDGVSIKEFTSQEPIYSSPSGRTALRSTWDGTTGIYTHYTAPTIDGPWTVLGAPSTPGTTGSLYQSSAPLEVGNVATIGYDSPEGDVYRFQLRNGIDGPVVADVDFTTLPPGTTAFADATDLPWSLAGDAEISDRVPRFTGEISEWPQKWVPSGADAWVPVQAAGILRRLGQGTKALDSALRRRIPSYEPLAYWPMEEGQDADRASTPIAGMDPLYFTNVQWGADSSLPSSAPLPTIAAQTGNLSHMSGMIRNLSWAPVPVWSVIWMYHMPRVPASRRTFMLIRSTGTVRDWYVQMGPDNTRLLGLGYEGETLVDRIILTPSNVIFGKWIKARFSIEQEGGNVRYILVWQDINGDAIHYENTLPGVIGRPTGVSSPPGGFHSDLNGMAIGHISAWTEYDTVAYDNAMNAWTGETAGARMLRLSAEESLPVTLTGPSASTEPVGYQDMAAVLALVRTAADADGGLLTEDQTALRIMYRPRSTLYSQEPALVLDYTLGQIAAPLDPVDDDTSIRNDVTVTREGGSSARVVLAEGSLSVQDPPDGVGVYDDSITLSLATDTQTGPRAFWELHLGTWDEPRYPDVTINLHRHPALIPAVLALREGDVIQLKNMPTWVAPDDVDLMVMGLKETLLPRTWTITYDCTPAGPWQTGAVGDGLLGRVDTDGSVLAAGAGTADGELLVHTPPQGALPPRPWITSLDRLTANPDFETDLAGWTATGGTLARVPTPRPAPFGGDWSMQLTPTGVAALAYVSSAAVPVTAGATYVPYGWLRCAVSRAVGLNVNWFDTAGAYLTTSAITVPVTAGTWTQPTGTVTAPAGAATAEIVPTLTSTPPASHVLLADVILLSTGAKGEYAREFPYDLRLGGEIVRVADASPAVLDTFQRTVVGGWGTADTGQDWTLGGAPADFSVGSGYGAVTHPVTGIAHITQVPAPGPDVDLYVDVATSVLAAGGSLFAGPIVRADGNTSFYMARLEFTPTAGIVLTLRRRVNDVETQLGTYTSGLTHTAGTWYRVRLRAEGASLAAKVWRASASEPTVWQVGATDSAIGDGQLGTRSFADVSSTVVNPQIRFDAVRLVTPQRMTVTRSVNSITKTHAAGTDVRLATPTRLAL
ncbi:hypothetical protein GCM10022384_07210 [Streptomyces marokkonensis]|uniref:Uncharacterized protein n=1 Tax=Streptomyces marokkonensis TaxID=324855 RepID=A0ABP7NYC6_9ACTN